jgi:hypothetical protein
MNYSHVRARRWRSFFSFTRFTNACVRLVATALVLLASLPFAAQQSVDSVPTTTYFSQDFSTSSVLTDYVSIAPNSGQFNAIGTSGAGMAVSIDAARLQFARTGNAGSFSRTADFAPTPTTLKYSFDLTITGNTGAQTTAAQFQLGSGFGTGNSAEPLASVFARFGFNFSATTGHWSVRNVDTSTNSATFTGTQTLTWFVNNSDAAIEYLAPDGTSETLVDNTVDLWVGTSIVLDDHAATTSTQTLTDIKFVFTAGLGTIQIDNIQIDDIAAPTAAAVSISGRVTDPSGNAVRDAILVLEGGPLGQLKRTRVNSFGNYRFEELSPGTYLVTVNSRRYSFGVRTLTLTVNNNVTDADFVTEPKE